MPFSAIPSYSLSHSAFARFQSHHYQPTHFHNSRWLAEVCPAALPAGCTDTYCPCPDWIRDLNNYLQSTGQSAGLSWAFTQTGQTNTAMHYVTANCESTSALPFLPRTNPDSLFHSERTSHCSWRRSHQERCKGHGGAGISNQYWPRKLSMHLNARLPK